MVAAVLANKHSLARIVVPRPLLLQSAQVLHAKLGSLVNRELMHIPFSRKTPTDLRLMHSYRNLHLTMCDRGGIMVTLPEHILSFKLSGVQQLADGNVEVSKAMVNIQEWLDNHARDVLDESDVSLAIRMQLIYPSGSQMSVDGHPLRWQVIQLLFHRTQSFITAVQSRYRNSVEVVNRVAGGFPLIYFLRKDAEDYLIGLLISDVCKGNCSFLPCSDFSEASSTGHRKLYLKSFRTKSASPTNHRIFHGQATADEDCQSTTRSFCPSYSDLESQEALERAVWTASYASPDCSAFSRQICSVSRR